MCIRKRQFFFIMSYLNSLSKFQQKRNFNYKVRLNLTINEINYLRDANSKRLSHLFKAGV